MPTSSRTAARAAAVRKTARNVAGRRPRRPWLLVGRIFCGCCGSRYIHTDSKGTHYYCCNVRKNREPRDACTTSPYIKMVDIDNEVKATIHDLLTRRLGGPDKMKELILSQVFRDQRELELRIGLAEAELAKADQVWKEKRAKVSTLLDAGYDLKTMPEVKEDVTKATESRERIASALYALMDQKTILDQKLAMDVDALSRVINRINDGLRSMAATEAAEGQRSDVVLLVKMLVKRVVVHEDRSRTIELVEDSSAIAQAFMRLLEAAASEVSQADGIKHHLERAHV
ncbi:conserved protein of unknown function [Magnetospirillum sp. XM-1]|uniref:zinc ribbon domain-containing protein n=1 Tax=Magnetospirillum sp. XM-1 TaxID=1663591 RepID=UPI00073DDDDF|nr:zinc ribbon domain-containing protein [Magnetospirillum sp. XM-1]CUW39789.1 conserved protein of unknown function [Magnetospirillum sp. XM-1]